MSWRGLAPNRCSPGEGKAGAPTELDVATWSFAEVWLVVHMWAKWAHLPTWALSLAALLGRGSRDIHFVRMWLCVHVWCVEVCG